MTASEKKIRANRRRKFRQVVMPLMSHFCEMGLEIKGKHLIEIEGQVYDYYPKADKAMAHGSSQWYSNALHFLFKKCVPEGERIPLPREFKN